MAVPRYEDPPTQFGHAAALPGPVEGVQDPAPLQPQPNYPEAAQTPLEASETGDPTPQETAPFALTTEINQYYRLAEGADEVSFEVAGTAPAGTRVSWVLMDSLNEMFEDHTEITDVLEDGTWTTVVYAHGPMDVIRVEFSNVEPEAPLPDADPEALSRTGPASLRQASDTPRSDSAGDGALREDGPVVLAEGDPTPEQPTPIDPSKLITTAPFDVIAFDAPEPASRTSDELTLRLQRHAKFVEGGLAVPSSPPMPFQVLPLANSVDIRIRMSREFAQRALSSGSIIDVAKALLLMIDESIYEIGDSDVAKDALAGKPPSLLV